MTNLIAYHNDPAIKARILAQLAAHREHDELIKGQYWENGKGCAVGCTVHSGDHSAYEAQFGIPEMLARLEDCIFEGLPNGEAKLWPERFMEAIEPGADLSRVGWQFLYWLLTDEKACPGINHETVKHAVGQCAEIVRQKRDGEQITDVAAARAARAAWAAEAAGAAAWKLQSDKLIALLKAQEQAQ